MRETFAVPILSWSRNCWYNQLSLGFRWGTSDVILPEVGTATGTFERQLNVMGMVDGLQGAVALNRLPQPRMVDEK